MVSLTAKQYDQLCDELVTNLALDFFEDDEIDHVLNEINSYDPLVRQKVLALALALSHASSSLVPGLLRHIKTASHYLSSEDLDHWLEKAFDLRDSHGIDQALGFLSRVDASRLAAFQTRAGLQLHEAAPLLETYLRAMSGQELKVMPADEVFTDTATIFLPAELTRFPDRDRNFFLYILASANAWAQIALGTFEPVLEEPPVAEAEEKPEIDKFFDLFPERKLAIDLYTIIESFRTEYYLMKELPGLMKQAFSLKQACYLERPLLSSLSDRTAFVEGLWQFYLAGRTKGGTPKEVTAAVSSLYGIQYEPGPSESVKLLFKIYDAVVLLSGEYIPRPAPLFIARIRPERVAESLREQRAGRKKKLEGIINGLIRVPDLVPHEHKHGHGAARESPLEPSKEYLLIKGRLMEVDRELRSLIEEKGGFPGSTLVKGSEMGGGSSINLADFMSEEEEDMEPAEGGLPYDEWDYRRGGYKKNWCLLFENEMHPGKEAFVERTLKRFAGAVVALRKKFELLRRERRMSRRQKDGDDIDLDAAVESFSDMHAGISPSENLFTRIERQERSIAVLFLVDMSGSTRGWVNQAEKESLVLMSEALETLGDRYAVYGFSGMTRNRCDLYCIKKFDEPYDGIVKQRIAGIEPKDYTRMGPFIRHTAKLLSTVDARTRLLITLSDSKPEDWDGYKGDYAIEDTRKALIEASGQGIHPFCITIDKEAQSYLPHLFGEVNYTFIDDVRKLPSRITEIYCKLTT